MESMIKRLRQALKERKARRLRHKAYGKLRWLFAYLIMTFDSDANFKVMLRRNPWPHLYIKVKTAKRGKLGMLEIDPAGTIVWHFKRKKNKND